MNGYLLQVKLTHMDMSYYIQILKRYISNDQYTIP